MRASHLLASLVLVTACASGGALTEDPPTSGATSGAGGATAGAAGVPASAGAAQGGAGAAGQAGESGSGGVAGESGSGGVAGESGSGGAAGGSGTGGSAGESGSGGSAGTSGTGGSAGTSGAGGSAGTSGSGGSAGTSGSGGFAGVSGSGGSAGGSGSGGAVTAGAAGAAGSGGAATGPRVVAVVTQSSAPPYVATFTDAAGWVETPAGSTVLAGRAGVARSGTGALVVARQPSSALVAATWSAGSLSTFAPLPGFPNATDGPSLSATPDGARLAIAYLGSDARHYGAVYTAAGGLPTAGPLGTDVPQAFGDSVASVAVGAASAYAAYSGDDHGVYALTHDGAQWSTSKPVMGAGTVPTVSPTVVVTNDVPTVLYVEGGGNPTSQVCATRRVGADYLPPACGQNVYTSRTVGAAPLANGKLLVAWHGLESNGNDQRIYAAELDGIKWGVVFQVDQEQDVTSAPVVVTGLAGADAEILYTKGGKLRHARVVGGVATVTVIGGANAVEVGAAVIP